MRLVDADALKLDMSNAGGWDGKCHIAQRIIDARATLSCEGCGHSSYCPQGLLVDDTEGGFCTITACSHFTPRTDGGGT